MILASKYIKCNYNADMRGGSIGEGRHAPYTCIQIVLPTISYTYRWRRSAVVIGFGHDPAPYVSAPTLASIKVSTLETVSIWMGDRMRAGKQSRYVTSQLGQLSLRSLRGRLIEYQPVSLG